MFLCHYLISYLILGKGIHFRNLEKLMVLTFKLVTMVWFCSLHAKTPYSFAIWNSPCLTSCFPLNNNLQKEGKLNQTAKL